MWWVFVVVCSVLVCGGVVWVVWSFGCCALASVRWGVLACSNLCWSFTGRFVVLVLLWFGFLVLVWFGCVWDGGRVVFFGSFWRGLGGLASSFLLGVN